MTDFLENIIEYNPPVPQVSPQEKASTALEVVALSSEDLDNPEESYFDIVNQIASKTDIDIVKRKAVQEDLDKDRQVLDKLISDTVTNSSLNPNNAASSIKSYQSQKANKDIDGERPEAFDRAISNRFSLDDVIAEEQTFVNYATRSLTKLYDESDWKDFTKEYGGFWIPDSTWDLSQFLDSSVFTSVSGLRSFTNKFYKMSPQEKIAVWPEIVERAEESFDNKLATMNFLSTLLGTDPVYEAKINLVFDSIDVGGVTVLPAAMKLIAKGRNLAKKTKDLNDTDASAVIVDKTLRDPTGEIQSAVGMTDMERAATVSPFKMEDVIPGAIDDIDSDLAELIETGIVGVNKEVAQIKGALNAWKEGKLLSPEFLSKEAQEQAIRDVTKRGLERQRELGESAFGTYGVKYENIRIGDTSPEGVEILYDVAGETLSRKELFTIDNETGMFHNVGGGVVTSKLYSPLQRFGDNKFLVETATRLQDQSSIMANSLMKAHEAALKPIKGSKKSLDKVDEVLRTGDDWSIEDGRVFTPRELLDGQAGGRTIPKLNNQEISAYYSLRKVLDEAHDFVNFMEYRKKQVKGLKSLNVKSKYKDGDEVKTFEGKPLFEFDEALKTFTKDRSERVQNTVVKTSKFESPKVYDETLNGVGGTRRLNKTELEEMYNNGFVLARLDDWTELGKDGVEYIITHKNNVSNIAYNQVRKREGYLPKFHKDSNYFVYKINKDGVRMTDRIFDNATDADLYRETMDGTDGFKYIRKTDRELTNAEWETEITNAYGGPFRGQRATHEILFGLEGNTPKRLDAYDSISRNLKYISNVMPINDWRASVQKMWLNTAKKMSDTEGKQILANPDDFWSEISGLPKNDKRRIGLEDLRNYLSDQVRIPTRDERMFDSMVRSTAEWMEKTALDKDFKIPALGEFNPRKSLMNLQHVDPFSMARTATFHPLLGFFNLSQLIVQAQGAAIAFATDPLSAPKRLAEYTYLRSIVDVGAHNLRSQGAVRKAMAKAAGIPEDEAVEIAEQFLKSGLSSSIKLSADMGAALTSNVSSINALKTVSDKGLVFYREGELVTRGYSFLQARANWKAANVGKKINDDALKEIIDETYRLMMNMSRANRAEWQKGVLSVPTQFTQVYWKFIGNLTGRQWSNGEKAKILGTQLALFGTAGVPAATYITNGALNMAGYEAGEIPEGFSNLVTRGFQGFVSDFTGIDNDFSARMAYMGNNDTIITKMFDGETPISEAMFGAFGSVFGRSTDAIKKLTPLVANPFMDNSSLTTNDLTTALSGIAKITSTWNNIQKVHAGVQMGRFLSAKGNYITDASEINPQTLVFKSLGFEARIISEHYTRKEFIKNSKDRRKKAADEIISLMHSYLADTGSSDQEELAKNFRNMERVILAMNGFHYEGEDWSLIKKTIADKIANPDDERTKAILKNIDEIWRGQSRTPILGETPDPLQRLQ